MASYYDLVIIGAGPGGYTAAIKGASFGMKVAVVDENKLGGVCINRGCIPTKALLHASNIFSMMQHGDEFGVSTDFISFDFAKMQDYKKRSVRRYRGEIQKLFDKNDITFIKGKATIRREKTIEVVGENGKEYLRAKNIIIATGAKPIMPNIPGIHLPGVSSHLELRPHRHYGRRCHRCGVCHHFPGPLLQGDHCGEGTAPVGTDG